MITLAVFDAGGADLAVLGLDLQLVATLNRQVAGDDGSLRAIGSEKATQMRGVDDCVSTESCR